MTHYDDQKSEQQFVEQIAQDVCTSGRCALSRFSEQNCTRGEQLVQVVWSSYMMVYRCGFEYLLQNDVDLRECGEFYGELGVPEVSEIMSEALSMIPTELQILPYDDAEAEYSKLMDDEAVYAEFKKLVQRFYEAVDNVDLTNLLALYIRSNPEMFELD
jgi:hypothetical protein